MDASGNPRAFFDPTGRSGEPTFTCTYADVQAESDPEVRDIMAFTMHREAMAQASQAITQGISDAVDFGWDVLRHVRRGTQIGTEHFFDKRVFRRLSFDQR